MAQKLSGEARKQALARLKGWSEAGGRDAISKKFVFADFNPLSVSWPARRLWPKKWIITRSGSTSTRPWR